MTLVMQVVRQRLLVRLGKPKRQPGTTTIMVSKATNIDPCDRSKAAPQFRYSLLQLFQSNMVIVQQDRRV